MSAKAQRTQQVREQTPVAENPDVIAYAFVRGLNGGSAHLMNEIRKGAGAPEGFTLAALNAGVAERRYVAFISIRAETGGGLVTWRESTRTNGVQGAVLA